MAIWPVDMETGTVARLVMSVGSFWAENSSGHVIGTVARGVSGHVAVAIVGIHTEVYVMPAVVGPISVAAGMKQVFKGLLKYH